MGTLGGKELRDVSSDLSIDSQLYQRQQNTRYLQRWQILRNQFLRYLDKCYVNPAHHKLKTFPLL